MTENSGSPAFPAWRLRAALAEIWPVAAVSGVVFAVLMAYAGRYGVFRDEFYIRESGRHLAWGYPDHPPLSPLIARIADELAPGSLITLRIPAALAAALTVLLIGLIAKEFGGNRAARFLASTIAASSILVQVSGHILTTATIDLAFASALIFVVARLLRTGDRRLWLVAGLVLGFGLLNRVFLIVYAVVLLAAVAAAGPRAVLRGRWLPAGVLAAALIALPTVIWQARNGWPEWQMVAEISAGSSRGELLAYQLVIVGLLLVPVWMAGLWWLLRHPRMRGFGVAFLGLLVILLVTGGREHYLFEAYPPLLAAGGIVAGNWVAAGARRFRVTALAVVVAFSATTAAVFSLPVLPLPVLADSPVVDINAQTGEQIGWPEMGRTVAGVVDGLPAGVRTTTVIVADNYGQAGAISEFGPDFARNETGFPPVYSGHQAYGWWGPPPERFTAAIVLGTDAPSVVPRWAGDACGRLTEVATVHNDHGIRNAENGTRIFLCQDLTASWHELWPRIRHIG